METKAFILSLLLAAATAHALNTLAVLEIIPKSEVEGISIAETRHLTDELRKQAVQTLPSEGYAVLTRDNMLALMPPDEAEAECLAESCAVEIGRAIGAEYISQGSIGRFGDEYSISIELYETMSGKLLGSIVIPNPIKKSTWLAISLDVLGAAALGFGIYQHIQKNKLYDDYKKMSNPSEDEEYKAWKKADDARVFRDAGFIAGGVLLGAGIAVHIWF